MITRSRAGPWSRSDTSAASGPSGPCPDWMSMAATSGVGNRTPTNENPSGQGGAWYTPRLLPFTTSSLIDADPSWSTSEKTTQKPVETAGVCVPATKKSTRLSGLPIALNVLIGLNELNWASYAALMNLKSLSLTLRPVPSVENTTPRARGLKFWLKKSPGNVNVLVNAGGTASQLTSRRPPFCSPTTLGLSGPSAVRKSVNAAVILHAAVKTDGSARSL